MPLYCNNFISSHLIKRFCQWIALLLVYLDWNSSICFTYLFKISTHIVLISLLWIPQKISMYPQFYVASCFLQRNTFIIAFQQNITYKMWTCINFLMWRNVTLPCFKHYWSSIGIEADCWKFIHFIWNRSLSIVIIVYQTMLIIINYILCVSSGGCGYEIIKSDVYFSRNK